MLMLTACLMTMNNIFLIFYRSVQSMEVSDFLNSVSNFPVHFASSEGLGSIPIEVVYTLDRTEVTPSSLSKVSPFS